MTSNISVFAVLSQQGAANCLHRRVGLNELFTYRFPDSGGVFITFAFVIVRAPGRSESFLVHSCLAGRSTAIVFPLRSFEPLDGNRSQ